MVKVRVPATTANLGPGYDVLGLALELHNFVEMEKADKLSIEIEGEGADSLPKDAIYFSEYRVTKRDRITTPIVITAFIISLLLFEILLVVLIFDI